MSYASLRLAVARASLLKILLPAISACTKGATHKARVGDSVRVSVEVHVVQGSANINTTLTM